MKLRKLLRNAQKLLTNLQKLVLKPKKLVQDVKMLSFIATQALPAHSISLFSFAQHIQSERYRADCSNQE